VLQLQLIKLPTKQKLDKRKKIQYLVNKLILTLLFLAFSFLGKSQDVRHNDLSQSDEVIFDDFLYDFQHGQIRTDDQTLNTIEATIRYYEEKNIPCDLGVAYAVQARYFYNYELYEVATEYFIKASRLLSTDCQQKDIDFNRYYLYNSWGMMKEDLSEYEQCDSILSLALESAIKLDAIVYSLNVKNNMANSLSKQAFENKNSSPGQKKILLEEAVDIMRGIKTIAWRENIEYHKRRSLQNLSAYFIDLQNYDSAQAYLLKLLNTLDEDREVDIAIDVYNNLGIIYEKEGNLDMAFDYTLKSLALAQESGSLIKSIKSLANLSDIENKRGNYKSALKYLDKYILYEDSLFDIEKVLSITRMEKLFQNQLALKKEKLRLEQDLDISQKDLQIEQQTKSRNTLLFIAGVLIVLLIASYSRLRYISRSKKIVETAKKRSDELLLNILPEEVAEELKNTGKSDARSFKDVTVLFTDFKDFTALAERLSPSVLVEEVNRYFKAFDEICEKHGIEKIKTIGDSYMAAGGVPVASSQGAKLTVMAALDMMDFVNKQTNIKGDPSIEMRVGINTGPVVAGIVGVKKFQYDIWGDTVNTASRMESAGEIGQINISHSTYELLKDDPQFTFEKRGKVETKGKGKLDMYYVSLSKS
jgi:class 3 adenylate cyclase